MGTPFSRSRGGIRGRAQAARCRRRFAGHARLVQIDDRVPPPVLHGQSAGSEAMDRRRERDLRGRGRPSRRPACRNRRCPACDHRAIGDPRARPIARAVRGSAAGARAAGPVLAVERDRRRALLHRSDGRCDPLPVRSARDAAWRRALAAAPDHDVEPGGRAHHGGRLCAGVRARRSSARRSRALRQSAARDVRAVQLRGSAERHRCARACAGGYRADACGRGERTAAIRAESLHGHRRRDPRAERALRRGGALRRNRPRDLRGFSRRLQ